MKIYDVYEDGTAVVSFYPATRLIKAMGFDNMYDLLSSIKPFFIIEINVYIIFLGLFSSIA